jgi:hypothetical protein
MALFIRVPSSSEMPIIATGKRGEKPATTKAKTPAKRGTRRNIAKRPAYKA